MPHCANGCETLCARITACHRIQSSHAAGDVTRGRGHFRLSYPPRSPSSPWSHHSPAPSHLQEASGPHRPARATPSFCANAAGANSPALATGLPSSKAVSIPASGWDDRICEMPSVLDDVRSSTPASSQVRGQFGRNLNRSQRSGSVHPSLIDSLGVSRVF